MRVSRRTPQPTAINRQVSHTRIPREFFEHLTNFTVQLPAVLTPTSDKLRTEVGQPHLLNATSVENRQSGVVHRTLKHPLRSQLRIPARRPPRCNDADSPVLLVRRLQSGLYLTTKTISVVPQIPDRPVDYFFRLYRYFDRLDTQRCNLGSNPFSRVFSRSTKLFGEVFGEVIEHSFKRDRQRLLDVRALEDFSTGFQRVVLHDQDQVRDPFGLSLLPQISEVRLNL